MCEFGLLKTKELEETLEMIHDVFMQFEASDYSQQGVDTFLKFIDIANIRDSIKKGELVFWNTKASGKIVGVLAVRNRTHICMLFVDAQFHRHGIAKRLLKEAFCDMDDGTKITVRSSPYAVPFYHAVGFVDTDAQMARDGIVFVPMATRCSELKI